MPSFGQGIEGVQRARTGRCEEVAEVAGKVVGTGSQGAPPMARDLCERMARGGIYDGLDRAALLEN
jgi:hypothetical protein